MNIQRVSCIARCAVVVALLPAWPASGSALTYHAVEPCRIVDTRVASSGSSPLAAGEVRAFDVSGSGLAAQGGTSAVGGCLLPPTAGGDTRRLPEAIVVNLIAVNAAGPGDLRVFPGSAASPPFASVINYSAGQTIAVGTTIPLRTDTVGDDFKIKADVSGTHVVVDVVGYYSRATSTTFTARLGNIPGSAGSPVTRYAPITGSTDVPAGLASQVRMTVPLNCSVDNFKVVQSMPIAAGGGQRAYILEREPNDVPIIQCNTHPGDFGCENTASVELPGDGDGVAPLLLYLQAFSAGAVVQTDAQVTFDMTCE